MFLLNMKKIRHFCYRILNAALIFLPANRLWPWESGRTAILLLCLLLACVLPYLSRRDLLSRRLRWCWHGVECLRSFVLSAAASILLQVYLFFQVMPGEWERWFWGMLVCILAHALVFWNGIVTVYLTSVQLGIRIRVIGVVFGFVPVVNLFILRKIIRKVADEVEFEQNKLLLDQERRDQRICATRYPLLLVHGVFFRDSRLINYWGRIPDALERNGASVFYGNHQSADKVADSAKEIACRIDAVLKETGSEKVNIIAHSKGGLDCRYALSDPAVAAKAASLTTINTPHRGCEFADYLLGRIPQKAQKKIENAYNAAMKRLGDDDPDFMSAVRDLTATGCEALNAQMTDPAGVFCQSVGSRLDHAIKGKFPLNFTQPLVQYFDGPNDGLVAETSFRWGEKYTFLTASGKRGISHGDVVDLNRENIEDFDVREFYVGLVADLKERGY